MCFLYIWDLLIWHQIIMKAKQLTVVLWCWYTRLHHCFFSFYFPSCWPPAHPFGCWSLLRVVCGYCHHCGSNLLLHEAPGKSACTEIGVRYRLLSEICLFLWTGTKRWCSKYNGWNGQEIAKCTTINATRFSFIFSFTSLFLYPNLKNIF